MRALSSIILPLFLPILLIAIPPALARADDVVLAAVASNFAHVMREIKLDNEPPPVRLSFGSSGNFSRQIIQGAPFDIFISASRDYIERIKARHIPIAALALFAEGKLSIYLPDNSRLYDKASLDAIIKALQSGEFIRLAIPNPQHAPYGVAARQALSRAGVWAIKTRQLVMGENAAQTMQFCLTGNVDACIVPSSLLHAVHGTGKRFAIPSGWHEPIRQYIALLDDSEHSRRLFHALLSSQSKAVLARFGYLPGDEDATN